MDCSLYLNEYENKLRVRAGQLLNAAMPEITRGAFEEYFLTGNRVHYERKYFGRREFLTVFGVLAIIDTTSDQREDSAATLSKLFDVIEDILVEPTWILPPHGSMENYDKGTALVDLFAAETAGSIAEILGLIKGHPVLLADAALCARYKAIFDEFYKQWQKRIYCFFTANDPCAWWEYGDMNWATVCAGNIGIAAYYLCKADYISSDEYKVISARVCKSMASYVAALGDEGVCTEGVGYYKYGMEYFLAWHEIAVKSMKEYNFNLDLPDFKAASTFPQNVSLGDGKFVNFSDSGLVNPMKMGLFAYLSNCYDGVFLPAGYSHDGILELNKKTEILGGSECHRFAGALRDLLWVAKYGSGLAAGGSDLELSIYPQHMWYVRRFADGTCIYAKGGHNDEPHNHNDIGSFAYLREGQEILCDLGPQEYVAGYFDNDKRYDFLCASSEGHNVPVLGDKVQLYGKQHKARAFSGDKSGFEIHFGQAYGLPDNAIVRNISIADDGSFTLTDKIDFSQAGVNSYTEVFIFRTKPLIFEDRVEVPYKDKAEVTKSVVLTFNNSQFATGAKLTLEELPMNEHEGSVTTVYRVKIAVANETFTLSVK